MSETETQVITREEFDALKAEVAEHRTVHVSRRGVQGIAGPAGPTGATGSPADPNQVAQIAADIVQKMFNYPRQNERFDRFMDELEADIARVQANLRFAIIDELKIAGVLDEQGNPHPNLRGECGSAGRDGADSTVAGPKGDSIVGPPGVDGRDAKIAVGSVTSGQKASVTLREENGVQVLDFVLPRGERGADSTVPGPKGDSIVGERGPEGIPGIPGQSGLDKNAIINVVLDLKKRGAI